MEINISLSTSQNSNVSDLLQFPAIIRIFTPILMVELLFGRVFNILLLTLLVKARTFQNNVNIYFCSMAVNNLLCLFPVSTSLVLTVTKQWVLGQTICTLNQAIMYMSRVPNLTLHGDTELSYTSLSGNLTPGEHITICHDTDDIGRRPYRGSTGAHYVWSEISESIGSEVV